VTTAGGVKCWGDNGFGQLGTGTTAGSSVPVEVAGLSSGVAAVYAGEDYTCAVTLAGGARCWGNNGAGQLGDGSLAGRTTPVDVIGLGSGVATIAAGTWHTCALLDSGGVKCWGRNTFGQLGDGTTTDRLMPVDVFGLESGVTAIAAGEQHTCALTTAGGIKCWGSNFDHQLGDGTVVDRYTPVDVVGLGSGVAAIVVSGSHNFALMNAPGVVMRWGGMLRCDPRVCGPIRPWPPSNLTGLESGVTAIAVGEWHACALTSEGRARCWGSNLLGQLGNGTVDLYSTQPDQAGGGGGPGQRGDGHHCRQGSHLCAQQRGRGLVLG
jgi:alpha-tubulin suppressor-like RCC1 family protein